jgi:hypothetical protein
VSRQNVSDQLIAKFIYFDGMESAWQHTTLVRLAANPSRPPIRFIAGNQDWVVPSSIATLAAEILQCDRHILPCGHTPTTDLQWQELANAVVSPWEACVPTPMDLSCVDLSVKANACPWTTKTRQQQLFEQLANAATR